MYRGSVFVPSVTTITRDFKSRLALPRKGLLKGATMRLSVWVNRQVADYRGTTDTAFAVDPFDVFA